MTERPIIFNAEQVRAVLDGRKTQHRIPVKFPFFDRDMGCELAGNELAGEIAAGNYLNSKFGKPGHRLWVRETWQGPLIDPDKFFEMHREHEPFQKHEFCEYAADGGPRPEYTDADDNLRNGWHPSIHMPRWASRITLEITGVRVERLQDISESDAWSEGFEGYDDEVTGGRNGYSEFCGAWVETHGKESWQANPWVWCISFKHVEATND